MAVIIITENSIFGEALAAMCVEKNIDVSGIFRNCSSIRRVAAGDLVLKHVRANDPEIGKRIRDLVDRIGDVSLVFLVSDNLSSETLAELKAFATIIVPEKGTIDALTSAITLAGLGYHLTDEQSSLRSAEQSRALPKKTQAESDRDAPSLSNRETVILRHLCDGLSNKSIALKLGITETTVKVHLRAVYRKIGVSNRTQAALWASRLLSGGGSLQGAI